MIHQPHPVTTNLKRCSRLVILPDYQGIGLGTRFLSVVADYYYNEQYQFSIVTSAKNMINALNKSKKWEIIHFGKSNQPTDIKKSPIDASRKVRSNVTTASFKYIGDSGKVWRKKKRVVNRIRRK